MDKCITRNAVCYVTCAAKQAVTREIYTTATVMMIMVAIHTLSAR